MKVIEVLGLPYTGKTTHSTAIERMISSLKGYEKRTYFIPDQIKNPPPGLNGDQVRKNLWAVGRISNLIAEVPRNFIVIGDRLGGAHWASLQALLNCGWIKDKKSIHEAERAQEIAFNLMAFDDLIVFIDIPAKVSLERDREALGFQSSRPRIVSPEVIPEMEKAYRKLISGIKPDCLLLVNGERPLKEVQSIIFKGVLSFLKKKDSQGGEDCRNRISIQQEGASL